MDALDEESFAPFIVITKPKLKKVGKILIKN